MPYKPRVVEMPDWIHQLAKGNDGLNELLTEAWVAGLKARGDVFRRGGDVPDTCSAALKGAEGILEAIRTGRVPRPQLAEEVRLMR